MRNTSRQVGATALALSLILVLGATLAQAQPLIVGNNAAGGGGPIQTYDFAVGGPPVASFVPTGALPAPNNGRGLAVIGNLVYYTELVGGGGFGPTDCIRVAPFNGGAGGPDLALGCGGLPNLPNPRPGTGVQDLAFSGGVLYALTGYPFTPPLQVFGLNPTTGVASLPVTIAGPASTTSDGFTVLPNGNFLINDSDGSCTYHQYNSSTGLVIPGTMINVPGGASFCTGVDTDGASLYFQTDFDSITKTDLAGNLIVRKVVDGNQIEDISLACPTCERDNSGNPVEVVVSVNTTVNFNPFPSAPVCSGDPGLCTPPVFSFIVGSTPGTSKAIFDVGNKKLHILGGVTITTTQVPPTGNNRGAPGIEIRSACGLTVDVGGAIVVQSLNQPAGDILINVDGPVQIDGTVLNAVNGTNGTPGDITVKSCCGPIVTGPKSKIQTIGQDSGGSDINIVTCCVEGNIAINGLVDASYKSGTPSTINVVSFFGSIDIDGRNDFGTVVENGTLRRVTSGVTVRSRRDPIPGTINLQAAGDLVVIGTTLPYALGLPNPLGAVAIKTNSNSSKGGTINARSLGGQILATDRAFDDANRFNGSALIDLQAKLNIVLGVSVGAQDVVSTQGGNSGTGGKNHLRSFSGDVLDSPGARVLADFTGGFGGVLGSNLIDSCSAPLLGPISPPPTVNSPVCPPVYPAAPSPLFGDCSELPCNVAGTMFMFGSGNWAIGDPHPITMVTAPPPIGPALIIAANPAWNTIPGTQWISNGNTTFGGPPNGTVVDFEVDFEIPACAKAACVTISALADDEVTVLLNGNPVALSGPCSPGACYGVVGTATICTGIHPGTNILRFSVIQQGGDGFGLDYQVTVAVQ